MKLKITIMITIVGILSVGSIAGQKIEASVSKATIYCNQTPKTLQVQFDRSLQTLLEQANNAVAKASSGSPEQTKASKILDGLRKNITSLFEPAGLSAAYLVQIGSFAGEAGIGQMTQIKIVPTRSVDLENLSDTLQFTITGAPNAWDSLGFVIQGVVKNPSMTAVEVVGSCVAPLASDTLPAPVSASDLVKPKKPILTYLEATKSDDNARLSADITTEGSKRTEPDEQSYFTTAKINFVPIRIDRVGLGGFYEIQPVFVSVDINTSEKKKVYKSEMGFRINHLRVFGDDGRGYSNQPDGRQLVPGLDSTLEAKFEVDRWFRMVNFVGSIKSGLPFNFLQSRAWKLRVKPYVGFAFGGNLKSLEKIEDPRLPNGFNEVKTIFRPFAGADLTFHGFRDRRLRPTLDITYVRHFPLRPETYFVKDASDTTIIGGQSRHVRDHVYGKLGLEISDLLTPFFSYERGRKAPGWELVNGAFKIGIEFKLKKMFW